MLFPFTIDVDIFFKFPITALREIKILKMLSHKNIIRLMEMAVERKS